MAAAQEANGWGEGSQCLRGRRNQRLGPRKSLAVAQLFGRGGEVDRGEAEVWGGSARIWRERQSGRSAGKR